ncbi:MAG: tRNA adenosine deaminase-associated protein [Kineosporiaceae bacterium]
MAYFTAVIARSGGSWRARDVEVDDATSLEDLTDALRSVAFGDQPVLAVVEHEDEWFAVVRVDGDDEPRLFVSDLGAASVGRYGALLAPAADVDSADDLDPAEEEDDEGDAADEEETRIAAWAGETDLLEDLGVSGRTLRKLVEESGDDPGAVLAEVGETVGFVELLDALR